MHMEIFQRSIKKGFSHKHKWYSFIVNSVLRYVLPITYQVFVRHLHFRNYFHTRWNWKCVCMRLAIDDTSNYWLHVLVVISEFVIMSFSKSTNYHSPFFNAKRELGSVCECVCVCWNVWKWKIVHWLKRFFDSSLFPISDHHHHYHCYACKRPTGFMGILSSSSHTHMP